MEDFPKGILQKLAQRKKQHSLRKLLEPPIGADFSSNDYLGFSKAEEIYQQSNVLVKQQASVLNGATGSRLISGNFPLYEKTENFLVKTHQTESALLFNSGYDANVGFFGSVPQREDLILYDELAHASIRQGIQMNSAKAYKFKHNDLANLAEKVARFQNDFQDIFVVTESVFSMDGDSPDLLKFTEFCEQNQLFFVVDEAHALGVFGKNHCGLIEALQLQQRVFATIVTFGKGLGAHGAAILGSKTLTDYLVNFAGSFIYTTGLSPHAVATIHAAYENLKTSEESNKLQQNIAFFKEEVQRSGLEKHFIPSDSAIQVFLFRSNSTKNIAENDRIKLAAQQLFDENLNVKAILAPTVSKGSERLRICLHSFNTEEEMNRLINILNQISSYEVSKTL